VNGTRLVVRARAEGAKLWIKDSGAIGILFPNEFPEELLLDLRHFRDEVAGALREEAEIEVALRRGSPATESPS
jgi:hypothetical protein